MDLSTVHGLIEVLQKHWHTIFQRDSSVIGKNGSVEVALSSVESIVPRLPLQGKS